MYIVQCTMYNVQCTMYILYILLRISYTEHYTLYDVNRMSYVTSTRRMSYAIRCKRLYTRRKSYISYHRNNKIIIIKCRICYFPGVSCKRQFFLLKPRFKPDVLLQSLHYSFHTLHNVHWRLCCTVYNVHCTVSNVHCTVLLDTTLIT